MSTNCSIVATIYFTANDSKHSPSRPISEFNQTTNGLCHRRRKTTTLLPLSISHCSVPYPANCLTGTGNILMSSFGHTPPVPENGPRMHSPPIECTLHLANIPAVRGSKCVSLAKGTSPPLCLLLGWSEKRAVWRGC